MSKTIGVRAYCAAISLAGFAVLVLLAPSANIGWVGREPLAFLLLAGGVVLGELLPVKVPRRGNDEEIVLSTSFSLALLFIGGLGPALLAQGTASLAQDLMAGKPGWRVRFNLGQYTLSMSAAILVMRLLGAGSRIGSPHPFTGGEIPAVLLSAVAFFLVNTAAVNVAIALYQRIGIVRYFRNNAFFVVSTGCVLLFLAPIVISAAAYSLFLVPLFVAPMLAIYHGGRTSVRSEHAARHDVLTGLPNRKAFRESVGAALEEAPASASVLLMDLDRFKEVNDTLGHHYGDLLLEQVAARVSGQLGEHDVLARLGGDEFAIFSPTRGSGPSATGLAQAVSDALRDPFELEEFVVDVEASFGVALFPQDAGDVETLLQRADVAMYRAKETHTLIALYDEAHDNHSPARLALNAELRSAIETGQIVVWYQPELDLAANQVRALEALVRWNHPALGLLPPGAFLDMAERTNLIKPLTQKVLQLALAQVAEWRSLGLDVSVAVNLSTRALGDRGFPARVADALDRAEVPADRLKLEVTESALMSDPALAREVLGELCGLGIELSIDDFGTGYSSLAYLTELPVSEVKIDRTFVSRMSADSRADIIVSSTIDLAHHLGLRAVAEGVEELDLLPRLADLGCDTVQGYAVARPLDRQTATEWLLVREGVPRLERQVVPGREGQAVPPPERGPAAVALPDELAIGADPLFKLRSTG